MIGAGKPPKANDIYFSTSLLILGCSMVDGIELLVEVNAGLFQKTPW